MLTRAQRWIGGLFAGDAAPSITPDTFLVWEPCTHSHAEVVPGYVKYLLDLGYDVSVLATPARFDEGLFSRFADPRVTLNRLSQRAIRRHFVRHGLAGARGILITTARKISGADNYDAELALFRNRTPGQKVLLVEHDVTKPAASGALHPGIITLRKIHYRDCATTVVNPHYFGAVAIAPRNEGLTRFITIGALRGKRRNTSLMVDAVRTLHERGIHDFRITIVGRGNLASVPRALRGYFDIRGRLDFTGMYAAIEEADFFLPLLDPDNPLHDRYITTGTSGSFQLVYGFAKPCLIAERFAAINGLDSGNSLVHGRDGLPDAMARAVAMPQERYKELQEELRRTAASLYVESLANLGRLAR